MKIREILDKYAVVDVLNGRIISQRIKGEDFDKLAKDLDNLDNWISVKNETIEDCQQKIRYLLKYQNFSNNEDDMTEYEKGFTVACLLAGDVLEEFLHEPPKEKK